MENIPIEPSKNNIEKVTDGLCRHRLELFNARGEGGGDCKGDIKKKISPLGLTFSERMILHK